MTSIANKVEQCEGLLGTDDLTDWEKECKKLNARN